MIPFKEVNLKTNYKQVILNDDYYGKIKIEYEIILDGTTGRFPYVKEKTSDDFYLLRSETIYYPLFITPYQENYYEHFNNPKESDLFLVNIKNHRKQIVLNNLKQGKDGLIGYNPTFAIGYFNEYETIYGSLSMLHDCSALAKNIDNIINLTNTFMNRYKQASINNLNIVVIPDGYGSFVLNNSLFLTEDTIYNYQSLIHELIHTNWNIDCTTSIQRCRFFDESIAQYFAYRICDAYGFKNGDEIIQQFEADYQEIIKFYNLNDVPIAMFAEEGLADLSYSYGVLALIKIERLIGINQMDKCLISMYKTNKVQQFDFKLLRNEFPEIVHNLFNQVFYGFTN